MPRRQRLLSKRPAQPSNSSSSRCIALRAFVDTTPHIIEPVSLLLAGSLYFSAQHMSRGTVITVICQPFHPNSDYCGLCSEVGSTNVDFSLRQHQNKKDNPNTGHKNRVISTQSPCNALLAHRDEQRRAETSNDAWLCDSARVVSFPLVSIVEGTHACVQDSVVAHWL